MKSYRVTRKNDGSLVYEYQAEAPIEWSGMSFEECVHTEVVQAADPENDLRAFAGRRRLTKLEFASLLGAAFPAILAAGKTNIMAETWVKMVELATPDPDGYSIDLDDPRLAEGLMTFETLGAVEAGTTERVLYG